MTATRGSRPMRATDRQPVAGERPGGQGRSPAASPRRAMDLQLFAGERVLPPSPRRLREARRRGEGARSTDLTAALLLVAVAALTGVLVPASSRPMAALARQLWGTPPVGAAEAWTVADAVALGRTALVATVGAAAPLLLVAWVAAAAAGLLQAQGLFQPALVAPRWERLSPWAGLGRLFSRRALVELAKAPLKLVVLAAVLGPALARTAGSLLVATGAPAETLVPAAARAIHDLLWRGSLAYLVVALADYAYQWWEHQRSLRMTVQEWKQDQKEAEGDPVVRQRIRQRQRQLARRRMLQEVPRADVVVTNPTHVAVALRYDPARMGAPVVVAKGLGVLALRIRAVAEAHDVPVMEEPALARALYRSVDVGREIPPALYVAVAEVLAFVWRLKGRSAADLAPAHGPGPRAEAPRAARGAGRDGGRPGTPGGGGRAGAWGRGTPAGPGRPGAPAGPVRPGTGEVT